jgi:transcriptional regulator with XRE-family HTH domain
MRIKDRIRTVMEEQGLDPMGLAPKLGVTANTVYRYLKGSVYPSADVLVRLCELSGLNLADLLAQLAKERQTARERPYGARGEVASFIGEGTSFRKEVRPLLDLLDKLNGEQLAALRQCAEALAGGDPDIERHLIAHLKFMNRMVSSHSTKRDARSR